MNNAEQAFARLTECTEPASTLRPGATVATIIDATKKRGKTAGYAAMELISAGFKSRHPGGWHGMMQEVDVGSAVAAGPGATAAPTGAAAPAAVVPGVVVPAWLQNYVNRKMTEAEAPRGAAPAASAAAPSATTNEGNGAMSGSKVVTSTDREGWAKEWQGSAALQHEFLTEASYVALRTAEKSGRVRRHGTGRTYQGKREGAPAQ
jgi:hypothetical protein